MSNLGKFRNSPRVCEVLGAFSPAILPPRTEIHCSVPACGPTAGKTQQGLSSPPSAMGYGGPCCLLSCSSRFPSKSFPVKQCDKNMQSHLEPSVGVCILVQSKKREPGCTVRIFRLSSSSDRNFEEGAVCSKETTASVILRVSRQVSVPGRQ